MRGESGRCAPPPRRFVPSAFSTSLLAALLVASLGRAAAAHAQTPPLRLEASSRGGKVSVSAFIPPGPGADALGKAVLDALRDGLRSEMVVELRLYERERGFASLLGDRLLQEAVITRTARRDPFEGFLVIEERVDGLERPSLAVTGEEELFAALFSVRYDDILTLPEPRRNERYLAARYRLSPIQLAGGLRIVALFFDMGIRTSEWSTVAGIGELP